MNHPISTYLFLACFWVLYFTLHSLLANSKVKLFVKKLVKSYYKLYRIGFNVVSLILFVIILSFQFSIETIKIYSPSLVTSTLGGIVFLGGVLALFLAFKAFNTKEFIGLQQLEKKNHSKEVIHLTKTGFYGLVRHPLYFATILLIAGAFIVLPTLSNAIFLSIVIFYLPIGVYFEEKKLIQEFGEEYTQYQKEVKAVIPFLF